MEQGNNGKKHKEDPELLKLGNRIRDLRLKIGYTNYEYFAYENDFSRAQYGKWEKGRNITYLNLLKIVKAFNMTLEEFFSEGFD